MVEIPVERKSGGVPWWVWVLLVVVALGLLIWWASDDEVVPVETETAAVVAVPPAGPTAVTDISMLLPQIPADFVGREVQLNGVQVQEVVGDVGFWIGPSAEQRIYAVLTEERTPETAMEGEADVNAGAMADITGTIRTREEVLRGLAVGSTAQDLPSGVDRFIVVSNYQVRNGR
ncbi:hypothetical protein ABVV53_10195 [Novosphingobium sp. RD2P27]|uniref:Uncharacterized protein n=1 Tax=Novosphingobium kalidii TaxID=3230299 RepID=A0ABV2D1T2_9SPHN